MHGGKQRGWFMRKIWWLLAIAAVLGLAYLGYQRFFGGAGAPGGMGMGGPAPVMVATVHSHTYQPSYQFNGRLQAVLEAEVRPQVSGLITAVHVQEGAMVKAGTPLFTIDQRTFKAAAAQGVAQLAEAKQAYLRGVSLSAVDAISKADLEQRRAAYQAAQAASTQALVDLDHALIKAPISGRVGRAEVTVGNVVTAGPGAPLLTTIQQLNPLYVEFELDEQRYLELVRLSDAAGLDVLNAPVAVGLAADGNTFPLSATLTAVDNRLGDATGSLRLRATLPNPSSTLLPGLFARVNVTMPVSQTAVLLNDAAIVTDQSKRMVWLVGPDGTGQRREVQTGPMVDGLRAITSGLQDGEQVVVNGLMRVQPGAPLMPVPADMRTLQPLAQPGAQPAGAPAGQPTTSSTK
jgi:membrane fusion protein, multidrug efflux system